MKSILLIAAVLVASVTFTGCSDPKPEHTFAFIGYQDGHTAFQTDNATYLVTCEGSGQPPITDDHIAEECKAVRPYKGRLLPPTYLVSTNDGESTFISIPSLSLSFDIDEAY